MSTPLTDNINALITYANSVTGASDTTLSQVFATLANGYSGGGSGTITYPDVDGKPLTAMINALVSYSNQVTGASDTTASEAIATLVAGYNTGGLDVIIVDHEVTTACTNTLGVRNYFQSVATSNYYMFLYAKKKNIQKTQNEFCFITAQATLYRYRGGAYNNTPISGAYDCILNVGDIVEIACIQLPTQPTTDTLNLSYSDTYSWLINAGTATISNASSLTNTQALRDELVSQLGSTYALFCIKKNIGTTWNEIYWNITPDGLYYNMSSLRCRESLKFVFTTTGYDAYTANGDVYYGLFFDNSTLSTQLLNSLP